MDPDQVYRIGVYKKRVESLVQRESGATSFGAKVALSLQSADPSFMNSVTGSICRAKFSTCIAEGGSEFYELSYWICL